MAYIYKIVAALSLLICSFVATACGSSHEESKLSGESDRREAAREHDYSMELLYMALLGMAASVRGVNSMYCVDSGSHRVSRSVDYL